MKRPWLAATLNLIPGVGYLYLNIKRPLGWLILGGFMALVISAFDPALNQPIAPSQGTWKLWGILTFLLPYIGFVADSYFEAKRINNAVTSISDTSKTSHDTNELPKGAVISLFKFAILTIVTLGLYQAYWSWRMWETVRKAGKDKYTFNIPLRAIFYTLSNLWLYPQIRDMAKQKGYKSKAPVKWLAALLLIIVAVGGNHLTPAAIFPFALLAQALIPLPIVKMQNYYMTATKGEYAPTKPNRWLIIFLVVLFVGVAIVSFIINQ